MHSVYCIGLTASIVVKCKLTVKLKQNIKNENKISIKFQKRYTSIFMAQITTWLNRSFKHFTIAGNAKRVKTKLNFNQVKLFII